MLRIYVAGPYTKGDTAVNVRNAIHISFELRLRGHLVYNPLLSHFEHLQDPHSYEYWMHHDLAWLEVCDALFRIEGESKGADIEEDFAREHGMRIFYSLEEVPI